jgi:hypothetical protein
MAGKKVSLGKILAELKSVISELEKEDPSWSDTEKKKAKQTAGVLKGLANSAEALCTDGAQGVPS